MLFHHDDIGGVGDARRRLFCRLPDENKEIFLTIPREFDIKPRVPSWGKFTLATTLFTWSLNEVAHYLVSSKCSPTLGGLGADNRCTWKAHRNHAPDGLSQGTESIFHAPIAWKRGCTLKRVVDEHGHRGTPLWSPTSSPWSGRARTPWPIVALMTHKYRGCIVVLSINRVSNPTRIRRCWQAVLIKESL
jgi:hypothetical protein